MTIRRYDKEFKLNAVALLQKGDKTQATICRELGIPESTMDGWKKALKANTAWVSDITQVKTNVGWLYIAAILDLYSRKIVGLSMSKFVDTELVAKAFLQAICHRAPTPGLIIHSDRGSQYLSKQYKSLVEQHGVLLSTSARGSCYDNAAMESFFGTLKTEHVYRHKFITREEAMLSIFEYVEVFYNRQRIHSTLGYLSPAEFEAKNMVKEVRI